MERTLILLKPDAVQRGLVGQIIARFEAKGLQLAGMKLMQVTPELAAKHYEEHVGKPFYDGLVKFVTGGPLVAMVIQGHGAVAVCRKLIGKTFGAEAEPGTIRGDYGVSRSFNLVHGSDSPTSGDREVALFFPDGCMDYSLNSLQWVYDAEDAE